MQVVSFSVILGSFWRHLGDIIIIIIIRPRPAFSGLGLGGWSREYSSPVRSLFRYRQLLLYHLSPHLEGIHKVSIVMSGGAVTVVVAGILLYCLIKWKLIKCCDRSSNNNYDNNNHQQPSAPPQPQHVVTMTSPTAPVQGVTQPELEMSLLKLQNQVMLQQLTAQGNQPHPQQAKVGGDGRGDINQLLALGLNRYPVV